MFASIVESVGEDVVVRPEVTGSVADIMALSRAVAVPGDSCLVERSMDCGKLPASVTGVKLKIPTGTETAMLCDTTRLARVELSPSAVQPTFPERFTWTVLGAGGGRATGGGCEIGLATIQS